MSDPIDDFEDLSPSGYASEWRIVTCESCGSYLARCYSGVEPSHCAFCTEEVESDPFYRDDPAEVVTTVGCGDGTTVTVDDDGATLKVEDGFDVTPDDVENDTLNVGDHTVEVSEGTFTDAVWECRHCGKRATTAEAFGKMDCEGNP